MAKIKSGFIGQGAKNVTAKAKPKWGTGTFYGEGVRQPVGKQIRGEGMKPLSPLKLKTPPKKVG